MMNTSFLLDGSKFIFIVSFAPLIFGCFELDHDQKDKPIDDVCLSYKAAAAEKKYEDIYGNRINVRHFLKSNNEGSFEEHENLTGGVALWVSECLSHVIERKFTTIQNYNAPQINISFVDVKSRIDSIPFPGEVYDKFPDVYLRTNRANFDGSCFSYTFLTKRKTVVGVDVIYFYDIEDFAEWKSKKFNTIFDCVLLALANEN